MHKAVMRDKSITLCLHVGCDSSEGCGEERVEVEYWNWWVPKCNVKADGGAVHIIGNLMQERRYW